MEHDRIALGSVFMTSKSSQSRKRQTPPKGQPTPSQVQAERERRRAARQVNLQWAAVIIVGLVILGLLLVFGNSSGNDFNHVPVRRHG